MTATASEPEEQLVADRSIQKRQPAHHRLSFCPLLPDAKVISNRKSSPNPECGSNTTQEDNYRTGSGSDWMLHSGFVDPHTMQTEVSENARSVGLLLSWGEFEFLNLADLTFNISQRLVCPVNQLGEIALYQPRLMRRLPPPAKP